MICKKLNNTWIEISLEYSLHIPGTSLKLSIIVVFTYILPECFLCLYTHIWTYRTVFCCCSVIQSCLTLWTHGLQYAWEPMDCSMPGFPVLHHLPEFAQTHVPWVNDAIYPSHSLLPPSPVLSLSQHEGLFQKVSLFPSGGHSIGVSASASVFPVNIQGWLPLGLTGLIFLLSRGLKSLLQHHNSKASFFGAQSTLWYSSHICTWLLEKS